MATLGGRRLGSGLALLVAWVTTTSALFGGCSGLFRPASPEPPAAGSGGVDIPLDYSDPDQALETIANAIKAKVHGNGPEAYIGAFADSARDLYPFYAFFDPEIVRRVEASGGHVPSWDLKREKLFFSQFTNLFQKNYIMRWNKNEPAGDDEINFDTGDALLHRKYKIFAVSEDGNTLSPIAVGLADLYFKRPTLGRWAIVRWQDYVDPEVGIEPSDRDQVSLGRRRLNSQPN